MAHRERSAILKELIDIKIKPGQRYKHYKTHGIYVIKEIVVLEATEEPAVAYYDEAYPELVWIRPYKDFTAQIDGGPRFSLLV